MLMRVSGIPIAAGPPILSVLTRCAGRAESGGFHGGRCAVLSVAALAWRSFLAVPVVPPIASGAGSGWNQTWLYYTNYAAFREMASPNLHTAWTFALNQFLYLGSQIPGYFLSPGSDKSLSILADSDAFGAFR